MENKNFKGTKVIAFIGTFLIWIPILFTLITAVIKSIATRNLHIDYLMPAELFPLALAGSLLLLWASRRSGRYKGAIGWSLVVMISSLFASQGIAVLTGLASGEVKAVGWPLFLVVTLLIFYIAAVIMQCFLGILLLLKT